MDNNYFEIDNKLISVIVPVYNVKPYLGRCINALIEQEYSEIEIILIDDGSSDGSGEICDKYSVKDSRIKVIHKENGGLSDARNIGIEVAKGDIFTFVDSDDWVSDDYLSIMYENMKRYDSDISGCRFQYVSDSERIDSRKVKEDVRLWDSQDALRAMLQQDGYTTSACGQLYSRELFDGIRFPIGKYYEDFATVYKLIHKARRIVHSGDRLYYYYKRRGSIQNEKYNDKHFIEFVFAKEVFEFIKVTYPEIIYAARERLVGICFHLILMMDKNQRKNSDEKELFDTIRDNRRILIKDARTSKKVRMGCLLSYGGISFVELVYKLFSIKGKIDL